MIASSILTCPYCQQQQSATMPDNACLIRYICLHCKKLLSPKEGDCCVFCSYGTAPCPPKQACCTNSG